MTDNEPQHLLIKADRMSRVIKWLPFLILVTIGVVFTLPPLGKAVGSIVGLFLLVGFLMNRKMIVIDKADQKVIIENRPFYFRNQRVIQFSSVKSVVLAYTTKFFDTTDYRYYVQLHDENDAIIDIDDSKNLWEMWSLGQRIGGIVGKTLTDTTGKQAIDYAPPEAREEAVERWKKRMEDAKEEKQEH